MWSNLGQLPLGRLYVVINDGYLAQVPEGAGAHLHNTDRYNTALQEQTEQDRPAADCRVAGRRDGGCHCVTTNHTCNTVYYQVVDVLFKQLDYDTMQLYFIVKFKSLVIALLQLHLQHQQYLRQGNRH